MFLSKSFKAQQSLGKQNTFTQVGYLPPDWVVLEWTVPLPNGFLMGPQPAPPPTNLLKLLQKFCVTMDTDKSTYGAG